MAVYQDYEIRINLNELIESRIPCCDLLHPDHCLTEQQVAEIAHDIRMDLDLHLFSSSRSTYYELCKCSRN